MGGHRPILWRPVVYVSVNAAPQEVQAPLRASASALDAREPAILVEGLRKSFGATTALDGIDLSVPRGAVLGLLGPNGAGKTTLVRILATILRPDAGRARVLSIDVVRQARALRPYIGLAGQYAAVDETLTARENLRLIGQLSHRSASLILSRVDGLIARFGLGGNDRRPVRTLPGGMRRRLDLAAALVHRPPVLFLDEPTTGLDPSGRAELWAVIRELVCDGTTVLLTTQYLEEADRLSDNVIVIDDGRIIAQGTSTQLKETLGTTILEVRVSDDTSPSQVAALLHRGGLATVVEDDDTIAVRLSDKGPQILDAVRVLDANRVSPISLDVREPSLDDVFLQLTSERPQNIDNAGVARSTKAVDA